MTWIRTRTPEEDPVVRETFEALGRLYPGEYGPGYRPARPVPDAVANDSIMRSHSLIPEAMFHAFATYGVLLASDLPLTRRQHEMIATTVSALNRCVFWIETHAEFLRTVSLEDDLVDALRRDWRGAALDEPDRAMLEYVEALTRDAVSVQPAHHDALRRAGFDDRGILQITLIAAWFNYINRVSDALGVARGGGGGGGSSD